MPLETAFRWERCIPYPGNWGSDHSFNTSRTERRAVRISDEEDNPGQSERQKCGFCGFQPLPPPHFYYWIIKAGARGKSDRSSLPWAALLGKCRLYSFGWSFSCLLKLELVSIGHKSLSSGSSTAIANLLTWVKEDPKMRMQDPIASVPGEISTWKSHILCQQSITVS